MQSTNLKLLELFREGLKKKRKKLVEFSTKGGSATGDFPLRKEKKKHGLKTLDFA